VLGAVSVERIWRAYEDGRHNAFTDLCRFGDHIYLTFRNCPDGHMLFTSSRILVLRSEDGFSWQKAFSFAVPQRDVRDPHFLVFRDRLFVYSGTWLVNPSDPHDTDMNTQLGYAAWTEDGLRWHGPEPLAGSSGYYIWRAAAFAGRAYLNGRRIKDFQRPQSREAEMALWESWLLSSEDGLRWEPCSLMQPEYGDETAFVFEPDGAVVAVARSAGRRNAQLCRARPPYAHWERKDLGRYIGGPLLARWEGHYLVGGRKLVGEGSEVTALYWLVDDRLEEILELPSGGDTSYPGFVPLGPGRGLLSYYSSHEGSGTSLAPCHIYLAQLRLDRG
jgi:hypothetical protein